MGEESIEPKIWDVELTWPKASVFAPKHLLKVDFLQTNASPVKISNSMVYWYVHVNESLEKKKKNNKVVNFR